MNILLYLEPVVFRANPIYFSPLINIYRCLINANRREDVSYAIASSPFLIEEYNNWLKHGGLVSINRYTLDPLNLLKAYNYDRSAYARDLFRPNNGALTPLRERLAQINKEFAPDIVLCATQNTVVQEIFGYDRTIFFERGPLPRWNGRDNFYFDSSGHQAHSILETSFDRIINSEIPDDQAKAVVENFKSRYANLQMVQDAGEYFRSWITSKSAGRNVALIAHQPADSILVAGGYGPIPPDEFSLRVLNDIPDDWVAVSTYHTDLGDYSAFDTYLENSVNNFISMPMELRQFGSDAFASVVDGIITIGSKAAFPPAVMGKKVVSYGQSMLRGFSGKTAANIGSQPVLSEVEAGKLLAFLTNRYTLSFEECFERSHVVLKFLEKYIAAADKTAFQLDMSEWNPKNVDHIFGES